MSFTRIASNQSALQSASALNNIGNNLSSSNLTLSTGKSINSVGDDPAGFSLARTVEARGNGLSQAISNIGNATSVLKIAEGGLRQISELTNQISEKAVQAADGSLNDTQRQAIQGEINALVAEINDISSETTFQDKGLIDGTFSDQKIQTGPDAGDTLALTLNDSSSQALGLDQIDVTTQAGATAAIDQAGAAQTAVLSAAQDVGEAQIRLSARENNLVAEAINNEAARSRVEDADLAETLVERTTQQILLQTSIAAQAQGNAQAEQVLSLF